MADDISSAIGKTAGVRLLPIATDGGIENLADLVFLRGVDLAIVPANVLAQPKAIERHVGAGLQQRLVYVTHLYAEEVHLLVGSGVGNAETLRGKKIAVPLDDGTAEFTARDLLAGFGVEFVRQRPTEAIAQVRSGAIAGILFVGGKPLRIVSGFAEGRPPQIAGTTVLEDNGTGLSASCSSGRRLPLSHTW